MIDIGVASPSAQGQAMIRHGDRGHERVRQPRRRPDQRPGKEGDDRRSDDAGTNTPETTSAIRWIGARVRCASPTSRTICASSVSRPTRSARMTSAPVAVQRGADQAIARPLGRRDRLAGEHRLVDCARPLRARARRLGSSRRRAPAADRRRPPRRAAPLHRCRRAGSGGRAWARGRAAPGSPPRSGGARRSSSTWPSKTSVMIAAAASK